MPDPVCLESQHASGPEEGDLDAADEEAEDGSDSLNRAKLSLGDLVDDALEPVQIKIGDATLDHLFEIDGRFELGGDFFDEGCGLFFDL